MLEIKGLKKTFGSIKAVDGVDISIDKGEMIGIIGRSGAGKSTLLRLLNRLIEADEGTISYRSQNVTTLKGRELRRWRAKCSMIFQQFNLVHRLDVMSNVLAGRLSYKRLLPSLLKLFTKEEKVMALAALEWLGMAGHALQRADTLSGGQQQRVAIAKALLQDPVIILADEPIASLDPYNAQKVMQALYNLNNEQGLTVLCNLHHLNTAKQYCSRIIGMREGIIAFDDTPENLSLEKAKEIYGSEIDSEELEAALGGNKQQKVSETESENEVAATRVKIESV